MKVACTILFLLGCCTIAAAQKNYVLNPSFEIYQNCPGNDNENISFADHWTGITDSTGFIIYTPEFRHECSVPDLGYSGIPDNIGFYQYPRSGSGMVELQAFSDESIVHDYLRDYLQGRLYKKLIAGKRYCVTFFVNLGEASMYAVSNLGAYFDNGTIDTVSAWRRGQPQTQCTPQVVNTTGLLLDSVGWTKIEGSFIATGNESRITIGNFSDKAHTTYVRLGITSRNSIGSIFTWYQIDDVSVIESDLKADAGPDTHVGYGDSVYIGIPAETGLENTWTRLGDTTVIGVGAGIWVKPVITTSYEVTQTLCGNVTKDTVKVDVWAAGISSSSGAGNGLSYTVAPNPSSGHFKVLRSKESEETIIVDVVDVMGRKLYSQEHSFESGEAEILLKDAVMPGLYTMTIHDKTGSYNFKLIVR